MEIRFSTFKQHTANHNLPCGRVAPADVRLSLLLVGGYPRPGYTLGLYGNKQSGRMLM